MDVRSLLLLTLCVGVGLASRLHGATKVLWDVFEQHDYETGCCIEIAGANLGLDDPSPSNSYFWVEMGVFVSGRKSGASVTLSVENTCPNLESVVGWMPVKAGDILDASTSHQWTTEGWFPYGEMQGGISSSIQVSPGEPVYLALFQAHCYDRSKNDAYGWVELSVDDTGGVSLMRSALAYPGDDISLRVGDRPMPVTVTADHANKTYCEGETVELSFRFSEPLGHAGGAYVFLVPVDEASRNLVECDAFDQGIPISNGATAPLERAFLTLRDGWKNCAFRYGVVVRSTNDLDDDSNIISTWGSDGVVIYSTNAVPGVFSFSMNGTPVYTSGETLLAKTAAGVQNVFEITAWDESYEVDLEDTNFKTVVQFWENGSVVESVTLQGNPEGQQIPHAFSYGGDGVTNKITAYVCDKDMTQKELLEAQKNAFTVFVETTDAPAISLFPYYGSNFCLESETGPARGIVHVDLTVPPSGLGTGSISVLLEVERVGTDDGNYPLPELNTYELSFKNGETRKSFFFTELDGTPRSENWGFYVRARVTTDTPSPDATKTWAQYYRPCDDFIIYVRNEYPYIGPGIASTNEIPATVNVPYVITWNVRDIEADLLPLTVAWTCSGTLTTTTENVIAGKMMTKEVVFTSPGKKVVDVLVIDKDGGLDRRSYYFNVSSTESETERGVPHSWIAGKLYESPVLQALLTKHKGDYDAIGRELALNGVNTIEECYIAGLEPADPKAAFMASIEMDVNGLPKVSWTPDLKSDRAYKVIRLEWNATKGVLKEVEELSGTSGMTIDSKTRSGDQGPCLYRVKVALP